jgi:hypothetical protein
MKEEKILGWNAKWWQAVNSRNMLFRKKGDEFFFYKRGIKILEKFYEKEKNTPRTRPDLVERKLNFEQNCRPYSDSVYKAIAIFDRIDMEENKVIITDYKSGDSGKVLTDFGHQLTLYWYAYQKCADLNMPHFIKLQNPEDLKLIIYNLPALKKEDTSRGSVDMKYLAYEINDADRDIKAKYFKPFVGIHCSNNCWWQDLCHDIIFPNNKEMFDLLITPHAERIKHAPEYLSRYSLK